MMIKFITLGFLLSFVNSKEFTKFISTNAKLENKKYDIKIINNENQKCVELESVNLEDMNLRFIKNNMIKCNGIRYITLANNFLNEIPNLMLRNVPYLYCLNLSMNYINLDNIHTLQHQYLQVLDLKDQKQELDKNMIPYDVEEIDEFKNATEVYKDMLFNSTNIFLPNLKYLDLSQNPMSAITYDFNTSFPTLTHLYLININAFTIDEQFFYKIPNSLRELHFENNQLKNLELKNIANITTLYFDNNPLENVNITSIKLRILSLYNCKLNTGIFNTPYLEQLDLSKNNLYNIDDIIFETHFLQTLLLDYNNLIELPVLIISQLSELSLSYNIIQEISSNRFTNLIILKKLSLKGNKIKNIEKDAFLGLTKLEYLDLSENKLSKLPFNWHLSLNNLQHLNVNSNNFTTIFDLPIRYISSLRHLSIQNNFLKKISVRELDAIPDNTTVYLA